LRTRTGHGVNRSAGLRLIRRRDAERIRRLRASAGDPQRDGQDDDEGRKSDTPGCHGAPPGGDENGTRVRAIMAVGWRLHKEGVMRARWSFSLLILAFMASVGVMAQRGGGAQAPQPTPEGYVPRGTRPAPNAAPGMKVTDLGKGGHTYRVNLTKGDDILSG